MAAKLALSPQDHSRVSAAVHAAEQGTAGEIVTITADRSDDYADVALWWAIGAVMIKLAALTAFPAAYLDLLARLTHGWLGELSLAEAFEMALALAVLTFTTVRLALGWMPLRLALTPRIIKAARTRARAISYFKVGAEARTTGRTGILIYVSLAEHVAEIIADDAIHGKVSGDAWGSAMAAMIAEVREGQLADGMIAAVTQVGAILAAHVPRADDDVNELPDRLIEL